MSSRSEIIIIGKTRKRKSNIWCDLCKFLVRSIDDSRSIHENGCCEECWLTFGQMRQREWKEGWRPDSETLNRYKQSRRIINIDIMKILGE